MADRLDFYFRQRVTEAELDLAFELLERADRDLAGDLGVFGVISGALPTQHQPIADLTLDLGGPARAYDRLGQRVFIGADQRVDCSTDLDGLPTTVSAPGRERWLAVFVRFERALSEPRTDGNSQQVFFRRDESFTLLVRQAPEAPIGAAPRVGLRDDELLLCDVRLEHDQTQLLDAHIDLSRRQSFVFAQSGAVAVEAGAWSLLRPSQETAQASFDAIDEEFHEHVTGASHRHPASDIDLTPSAFITETTVQGAHDALLSALTSTRDGAPGASHIGADAAPGSPHGLGPGTVDSQLSALLGFLNAHLEARARAHAAGAISALPHHHIEGESVQAQLSEIVESLASRLTRLGAALIGSALIPGDLHALGAGTVRDQLEDLLQLVNQHILGSDHDGRYLRREEQARDADTVDGAHAAELARAEHTHDERYLRRTFMDSTIFEARERRLVTTLADPPELVTVSYNYLTSGVPQATTFARGQLTPDLRYWITKRQVSAEDKEYELTVHNDTAQRLFITTVVYHKE